jgi:hypothetical protein
MSRVCVCTYREYNKLHVAESFLTFVMSRIVTKCHNCYGTRPWSQYAAAGPCPQPDEYSPHAYTQIQSVKKESMGKSQGEHESIGTFWLYFAMAEDGRCFRGHCHYDSLLGPFC